MKHIKAWIQARTKIINDALTEALTYTLTHMEVC